MKVLHITSWYPSYNNPKTALWIYRHIESLNLVGCENTVYHVESARSLFEVAFGKKELLGNKKYLFSSQMTPWFLLELIAIVMVILVLFRERKSKFDIINFHIAYPNLTYWHWIKRWVKTPIVITEHWSAYHNNFGMASADDVPRIQHIFRQNIPVISVSKALSEDIKRFSGANFPSFIVPNIVDNVFLNNNRVKRREFFFMLSQWKPPKDPFPLFNAFVAFNSKNENKYELQIGGYGTLYDDMIQWKNKNDKYGRLIFLGKMNENQIVDKMQTCALFLHPTNYETFSVVCAEAISCGATVIAPKIGGIPEVIGESGWLLSSWCEEDWFNALCKGVQCDDLKRESYASKYTHQKIGSLYKNMMESIIDNN
ncbi:glycosyltransferase family 4 protein [Fulvivirga ligni]|uniref:glycosyltransferase family 4 protein n=1 Tax=Fulvivirga ligni TaxID=2904246 RepID=UPI001F387A21|nr:glycosyltransferase [Fulvivirga ligni]UII21824.1 glycosyltransferase [Fulvivirga ligni]